MPKILFDYPYLYTNLISVFLLTFFGKRFLSQERNKMILLSGLINLPCFPFLLFLEGAYWSPARVGGWLLGIEDVLCTYAVAAICWYATVMGVKAPVLRNIAIKAVIRRYCIPAGISGAIFMAFFSLGISGMVSLLLVSLIMGLALFIKLPHLRKLSLAGMWKFPLLYLIVVRVYFFIWKDFVWQWNTSIFLGRPVFGIPLGEIVWCVLFGMFWPLFLGYVLDMRLTQDSLK